MWNKSAVILLALGALSSIAGASDMRSAHGEPCHPTEKTYFESDGVTPFACAPAGGPAYAFKVFVGDKLLWEGILASTEPAAYFNLPAQSEKDKVVQPRLVVRRDLGADPKGSVVFFGETRVEAFETFKSGASILQLPRMLTIGKQFKVGNTEVATRLERIDGTRVDFSDYRFVVGPAKQPERIAPVTKLPKSDVQVDGRRVLVKQRRGQHYNWVCVAEFHAVPGVMHNPEMLAQTFVLSITQ